MTTAFTLQFLQQEIGEQYVELNPVTQQPRIIQGLNEVWQKIDEHGGVSQVAKVFGLSEAAVWGWVDEHSVPELYVPYLVGHGQRVSDVQLSSVGYEDPVSGECWPWSWSYDAAEVDRNRALTSSHSLGQLTSLRA